MDGAGGSPGLHGAQHGDGIETQQTQPGTSGICAKDLLVAEIGIQAPVLPVEADYGEGVATSAQQCDDETWRRDEAH